MQAILVRVVAVVFLAYGTVFLFWPETFLLRQLGEVPIMPSAMIDVRATYGGLSLGLAGLLFKLAAQPTTVRAGVWAVILALGGMAVGRCYGLIVDGSANGFMYLYLALEILAVAVSFVVLALRPSFHQE
ncbi:MAG: DUF4345 family protein [Pseudomonadota bacterium]|nr:DUF4345 family protein [Pseudomonadota bacterium]